MYSGVILLGLGVVVLVGWLASKALQPKGERPNVDVADLQGHSSGELRTGNGSLRGDHLDRRDDSWKDGRNVWHRATMHQYGDPDYPYPDLGSVGTAKALPRKKGPKKKGDSWSDMMDRASDFRIQVTDQDGRVDYDDNGDTWATSMMYTDEDDE